MDLRSLILVLVEVIEVRGSGAFAVVHLKYGNARFLPDEANRFDMFRLISSVESVKSPPR